VWWRCFFQVLWETFRAFGLIWNDLWKDRSINNQKQEAAAQNTCCCKPKYGALINTSVIIYILINLLINSLMDIDPLILQLINQNTFIKHHISQIRLTVLHRQKRTYLSTKQTRCHPYKYHKPATVQCHTKLCRNLVNIWLATDDPLLEHEDVLHAIWNINTKSCNRVINSNTWNC